MIEVKEILAKQTFAIRKEVLRKGMNLSTQFSGDEDIDTFHLGIFENKELVGIASFMKSNNILFTQEQYQLRGMATIDKVRGRGYGKLLLQDAITKLRDKKIEILWCNARVVALEFYKKSDFIVQGNSFEIPQIGTHYLMFKKINNNYEII